MVFSVIKKSPLFIVEKGIFVFFKVLEISIAWRTWERDNITDVL